MIPWTLKTVGYRDPQFGHCMCCMPLTWNKLDHVHECDPVCLCYPICSKSTVCSLKAIKTIMCELQPPLSPMLWRRRNVVYVVLSKGDNAVPQQVKYDTVREYSCPRTESVLAARSVGENNRKKNRKSNAASTSKDWYGVFHLWFDVLFFSACDYV